MGRFNYILKIFKTLEEVYSGVFGKQSIIFTEKAT